MGAENVDLNKEVVFMIPSWLTARRSLGAYNSIRKYYPDIPVYFVDDEFNENDVPDWNNIYHSEENMPDVIFDPGSSKLVGLHNSAYIRVPHNGYETEGHGNGVTEGMKLITAKWVVHFSSDARVTKANFLEHIFDGVDNSICGIGVERILGNGLPNLNKVCCVIRGDLYHEHDLNFRGNLNLKMDAGTNYFNALVAKGYKLKIVPDLYDYVLHLKKGDDWERLF